MAHRLSPHAFPRIVELIDVSRFGTATAAFSVLWRLIVDSGQFHPNTFVGVSHREIGKELKLGVSRTGDALDRVVAAGVVECDGDWSGRKPNGYRFRDIELWDGMPWRAGLTAEQAALDVESFLRPISVPEPGFARAPVRAQADLAAGWGRAAMDARGRAAARGAGRALTRGGGRALEELRDKRRSLSPALDDHNESSSPQTGAGEQGEVGHHPDTAIANGALVEQCNANARARAAIYGEEHKAKRQAFSEGKNRDAVDELVRRHGLDAFLRQLPLASEEIISCVPMVKHVRDLLALAEIDDSGAQVREVEALRKSRRTFVAMIESMGDFPELMASPEGQERLSDLEKKLEKCDRRLGELGVEAGAA